MFHHNCTYNDRSRARIKPGTHQGAKDTSAFGSIEDRNSCTPLRISIYHTTAPICIPSRTFPIHTPFPLTNSDGIYNKLHGVRLHSNLSSRSVRSRFGLKSAEIGYVGSERSVAAARLTDELFGANVCAGECGWENECSAPPHPLPTIMPHFSYP